MLKQLSAMLQSFTPFHKIFLSQHSPPSPPQKKLIAVTKMETLCRIKRVKPILEFCFINSFGSHNLCYINCNFDNKAAENKSSLVRCVGVWLCLYESLVSTLLHKCMFKYVFMDIYTLCGHVLFQYLRKLSLCHIV